MKYYEINEAIAEQAQTMNSFREYKKGSATEEYKRSVDAVYETVEEIRIKRPENAEKAEVLADRYAKKLAEWINKNNRIRTMCPSVMISGAGNFPVARKKKQNEASDRHYKDLDGVTAIQEKIEKLLTAESVIKAGDENTIELLEAKLEKAEALQAAMKIANAHYRKHKTMKGYGNYTDEKAAELDKSIESGFYKVPFAPYQLTNNNAKIKNIKARIASIQRAKNDAEAANEQNESKYEDQPFEVVENAELMRLQLIFDGKPDEEVRSILKSNGFKWSPKNAAWQRQLTDNAKYALERVISQLNQKKE